MTRFSLAIVAVVCIALPGPAAEADADIRAPQPDETSQAPAERAAAAPEPLKCMRRFRFKDFAIGIWRTPPVVHLKTDAEKLTAAERYFRHCSALGLTVVKTCHNESPAPWLQAAGKLRLPVIIHACKGKDEAWGPDFPPGKATGYARPEPFKWLFSQYGRDPNVVGYLLNDNCGLHGYTVAIAQYLSRNDPGAIPWISTNPNPAGQARVNMPVVTSQIYAYLCTTRVLNNARVLAAKRDQEPKRRLRLCGGLERDRATANRHDLAVWPLLICSGVSPAQLRFQCYASLAYGAQGIWYFHVFGVLLPPEQPDGEHRPSPLYEPMTAIHPRVLACGRELLGHRSLGVFHTGSDVPRKAPQPAEGEIIESMSDHLLAGVLATEGSFRSGARTPSAVMVVDKRTLAPEDETRRAKIRFGPRVKAVKVFVPDGKPRYEDCPMAADRSIELPPLRGGQGVLLKIETASESN